MTAIFRRIACVGDSLSSGELEVLNRDGKKVNLDLYEHSWGKYIARMTGAIIFNFSRSGMTAKIRSGLRFGFQAEVLRRRASQHNGLLFYCTRGCILYRLYHPSQPARFPGGRSGRSSSYHFMIARLAKSVFPNSDSGILLASFVKRVCVFAVFIFCNIIL